ncbi:MAG TPA: polysaccharide deacetylase family protein [Longimicrobium sp.]
MGSAEARPVSPLRAVIKRVAERTLSAAQVDRLALALRPRGLLVLAWHNVVPAGERVHGDASLHLPRDAFARQLDALARTHHVVPLAQAFERTGDDRPRAVITFDDACLGAVTAGVDELETRGLPATIFVAPGLLGTAPWWDELAGADGLDPSVREHALDVLGGRPDDVRAWGSSAGLARHDVPAHQHIATEDELRAAAGRPGITLAPHGWSHTSLPALSPDELEMELARPLAWLRERFANGLPWLAYPYGHTSAAVEDAVARAGYTGAFRVDGGAFVPSVARTRPFALPRLNVAAGVSDEGFRLRIAGVRRG